MNFSLRWCSQVKRPAYYLLFKLILALVPVLGGIQLKAQSLSTEPLAITYICPGSPIIVTGVRAGTAESYGVELSADGVTYSEIPSVFATASGRYEITYNATIPANTAPGKTYRVRIVSKNPDVKGSPSSSTLVITSEPDKPVVPANTVSICQSPSASPLSATVTAANASLVWYGSDAAGGMGTLTPTQPLANQTGIYKYYVSQRINDCESQRAEITVEVKPSPAPPTVQSVTVCQNTTAPIGLTATGQNLLWYTTQTGGIGTTTAPVVSTSMSGQTTYYVSQSQSLSSCESSRAALTVAVNSVPAAPTVTPKAVCQFSAPQLATAAGRDLTWYGSDGKKLDQTPVIDTDKSTSFTVQVTQTLNGCESARAMLPVTISPAPLPLVGKTIVELCQGAVAQPLSATGVDLKWTDPTGVVSTTAPTPSTVSTTKNTDGDAFYVTQTTGGCESPKVVIRVFVQVAPTLSILGTTTANVGQEVPLQLLFTGVGPYTYKLTNNLTGKATKDTTILILLDRTMTYQVTEVSNNCGTSQPGSASSVTLTALTPTIQTLAFASSTLCAGTTLTTNFTTSGTFNQGSIFKLQLAKVETDTTKTAFVDLTESRVGDGTISGTISNTTPAGTYWVRVLATNPKIPINGTISPTLLTVRAIPAARITGNQSIFEGKPASLSVIFSGSGPWTLAYRDSSKTGLGVLQSITTSTNPYVFEVRPTKTTSYGLISVSNGCGIGTLADREITVTVNTVLGIDDQLLSEAVEVYPVPVSTTLEVRIRGLATTQTALLELIDVAGHAVHHQETRQAATSISVGQHPAGLYILRIRIGDRTASKRVLKL